MSRACLCDDGTYSIDCCDDKGGIKRQGIGQTTGQSAAVIKKPPIAFSQGFSKGFQ